MQFAGFDSENVPCRNISIKSFMPRNWPDVGYLFFEGLCRIYEKRMLVYVITKWKLVFSDENAMVKLSRTTANFFIRKNHM